MHSLHNPHVGPHHKHKQHCRIRGSSNSARGPDSILDPLFVVITAFNPSDTALNSPSAMADGQKRHNNMDTLGIEPRAFRMQSGCDTGGTHSAGHQGVTGGGLSPGQPGGGIHQAGHQGVGVGQSPRQPGSGTQLPGQDSFLGGGSQGHQNGAGLPHGQLPGSGHSQGGQGGGGPWAWRWWWWPFVSSCLGSGNGAGEDWSD